LEEDSPAEKKEKESEVEEAFQLSLKRRKTPCRSGKKAVTLVRKGKDLRGGMLEHLSLGEGGKKKKRKRRRDLYHAPGGRKGNANISGSEARKKGKAADRKDRRL